MLTRERERNSNSTYIELKNATNFQQKNKYIEKLAGPISASVSKLQKLKSQILQENDVKTLTKLLVQYEKTNDEFNSLLKSLGEIDESSQLLVQIKDRVRRYIESNESDDIKKKFDYMRNEKMRQLSDQDSLGLKEVNEELHGQLLASDKHTIRNKILLQEKKQLEEIQKMIYLVKDIAQKTSIMINAQGEKIQLSLARMQTAKKNFQEGRKNLTEANQFQQDTNKKYIVFCLLIVLIVSIIVMIMYSARK